jgi:hypothetical protein
MRSLSKDEYETLVLRCEQRFRDCAPECIQGFVAFDSKPGHTKSTLDDLIQRGLLDHYECKPIIAAGGTAAHYFTNTKGMAAMTVYRLIESLGELDIPKGA